jgi:hypothetical protein
MEFRWPFRGRGKAKLSHPDTAREISYFKSLHSHSAPCVLFIKEAFSVSILHSHIDDMDMFSCLLHPFRYSRSHGKKKVDSGMSRSTPPIANSRINEHTPPPVRKSKNAGEQSYTAASGGESVGAFGGGGGGNGDSGGHHGGVDYGCYDSGGCDYGGFDGCFSGDSEVHMADGTRKLVKDLIKGDLVSCDLNRKTSEVTCLLVMEMPAGPIPMVVFPGGLNITPRHLILIDGGWIQSSALGQVRRVECRYVYNIMLDHESTVIVNGVTCIALGHGSQGKLQHEFWGDWDRLAKTMREIDVEGFQQGQVLVGGVIRDATSGRVCGFTKPTRNRAG